LLDHFLASNDLDAQDHLASLIARYGTEAILPQILEELDRHVGLWACDIQNPILAYVLRVDPAAARPRLEKAVAARGDNYTACRHTLFQMVSELHYSPELEEVGIQGLDDKDTEVAMTAATMLGRYGSAAAESALWKRYESWCVRWTGKEEQLDLSFADRLNERLYQRGLGENLMRALATGQSWLSDQTRLRRLLQVTTVPKMRKDLEGYLKAWEAPAFTIDLHNSSQYFSGRVAQYELNSMKALKDKLSQFPPGTRLVFGQLRDETSENQLSELRSFLESHKMIILDEKPTP